MKLLLSFLLLLSMTATASSVINQDEFIGDAEFSSKLFQAYKNEMEKKSNGSYEFSNLLRCKNNQCWILKNQWSPLTASGSMKNKIFTPVTEDAVFDLTEYMRVKPQIEQEQGHKVRTKEIAVQKQGLVYSLNCAEMQNLQSGKIVMAQCILINGIPTSSR